jgi:hypothetical protein
LTIDAGFPKTGKRVGVKFNNNIMKKSKRFISVGIFIFLLCSSFTADKIHSTFLNDDNYAIHKNSTIVKHVDLTWTSNEGCTVHIVGDVDFNIFPKIQINSFTGTVAISGSHGCPNITLSFSPHHISNNQETVDYSFDTDDPCTLLTVTWSNADNSYLDLLNNPGFNIVLVNDIHTICS